MTYEELVKLLCFNDKENNIFMPNEIFTDLKQNVSDTSSHISFAYSYVYFVTWLYRYAKYANIVMTIDQKMIKEILGYNASYKKLDYLIKKNGILEQIEYIKTTTDYPVAWNYREGDYDEDGLSGLNFDMYSEFKDEEAYKSCLNKGKNFKVKYPVKAFHRHYEEELDGTFYDIENTHLIPFEVFLWAMSKEEVGVNGFYIWCYLKSKCQIYSGRYDVSVDKLANEIGLSKRTLLRYMGGMRKYRMVDVTYNQEYFVFGLKEEDRRVNSYRVNEFELFSDKPVQYEKLQRMKYDDHLKLQQYKEEIKKVTF